MKKFRSVKFVAVIAALLFTLAGLPATALATTPEEEPAQLVQPNPDYPNVIPIQRNITQISTYGNSIGIDDTGGVWTWGRRTYAERRIDLPAAASKVLWADGAFLAITEDGALYEIDLNNYTQVEGLGKIVDMAGMLSVFVQNEDGVVYGWGDNTAGELGLGYTGRVDNPVEIPFLYNRSLPLGSLKSRFLIEDGQTLAWGFNYNNKLQLEEPGDLYQTTPALSQLTGIVQYADLSSNVDYSISITEDGDLLVWGYNESGMLGLGHKNNVDVPTIVPLDGKVKQVGFTIECSVILKEDGTVWTSGNNHLGLAGTGGYAYGEGEFVQVNLPEIINIEVGATQVFAQAANGDWWAWGQNYHQGAVYPGDSGHGKIETPVLIFVWDGATNPIDPPDPEPDTHNVTIVVKYNDGAHPDEVATYEVPSGSEFFESYTVQPGYEYRSVSAYSLFYDVDATNQTVYINEVNQDITIELQYEPLPTHNVTVIVKYNDGAYPDEVTTYEVPAGAEFFEPYTVQPGYEYRSMSVYSLFYDVDATNQTVYINEVNQDITVELQYERAFYNVNVTTVYADGALPDDTQTYAARAGEPFDTTFEMLDGYTIDRTQANILGVTVDAFDQTIAIRSVNGEVNITLILKQK